MSNEDANKIWHGLRFRVHIYEISGNSFQHFVNNLYLNKYPGYKPVKAWGTWGDGGNDGYIKDEGHYFQMYGPEVNSVSSQSPHKIVNKAITDFHKLQEKWPNVIKYHFVFNDRFNGIPSPLEESLRNLQDQHNLSEAKSVSSGQLENDFNALSIDKKIGLFGAAPGPTPEDVYYTEVGQLLTYLADTETPLVSFLFQISPNFDEKIKLNGLTEPITYYLRNYAHHVNIVEDFFTKRGSYLQQSIAKQINLLYNQTKKDIPNTDPEAANIRYVSMVEKLIPQNLHCHSKKAYREAAQIILAKYFEACDIYDHPDSFTAS